MSSPGGVMNETGGQVDIKIFQELQFMKIFKVIIGLSLNGVEVLEYITQSVVFRVKPSP